MEIGGVSGSANWESQIYELTLISRFLQRRSSQIQTFQNFMHFESETIRSDRNMQKMIESIEIDPV